MSHSIFGSPSDAAAREDAFCVGAGLPTLAQFDEMERAGWIKSKRIQTADGLTYRLFNYTKNCTYKLAWNAVTTVARGLIVCEETGEVIAAAMPKFYNLGEVVTLGVVASPKEGNFEALVKLDGACAIGYRLDRRYRFATRGSFTSDESAAAQAIWNEKYAQHDQLLCEEWNHLTLIVEIIHPKTRVVCRYDFEDLVLIAARNRYTGQDLSHEELVTIGKRLNMPVVERIDGHDIEALIKRAEALDGNQEGFVFHWPCGYRLKVKGAEYKRIHKAMSGLTPGELARAWWDTTLAELLSIMPEEFREETEELVRQLDANTLELVRQTEEVYRQFDGGNDQKAFAAWVMEQNPQLQGFLFVMRQQQQSNGERTLCRAALSNLLSAQSLMGMLAREASQLSLQQGLETYLESVGSFLWDRTRTAENCGKLKGLSNSLPKQVRSAFDAACCDLQPQTIIEKMREFVRRSANVPELAVVDIDNIFATAPAPTCAEGLHHSWVFAQPSVLRPFLDRWRQCGQRETALSGARKMLAEAVRAGVTEQFLDAIGRAVASHTGSQPFDGAALICGLKSVEAQLSDVWRNMPHGDAQGMARAASIDPWAKAILNQAWAGPRALVRDLFIASDS